MLDIVRTFLVASPAQQPPEVRERLRCCIADFVQILNVAVTKNNSIIGPAQLDFQTLCEVRLVLARLRISKIS